MIDFHKYALFRSHFSNPHSTGVLRSYSHYGIPLEEQASHPKNLNRPTCPNNACHLSDRDLCQFHFLHAPHAPIFKTIVNKGVRK